MRISKKFVSKYENGGSPSSQLQEVLDWKKQNPNVYGYNVALSDLTNSNLNLGENQGMIVIDDEMARRLKGMIGPQFGGSNKNSKLSQEEQSYYQKLLSGRKEGQNTIVPYDLKTSRSGDFSRITKEGNQTSDYIGAYSPAGAIDRLKMVSEKSNISKYPELKEYQDVKSDVKKNVTWDDSDLTEIPENVEPEETFPTGDATVDFEEMNKLNKPSPTQKDGQYAWKEEFNKIMEERERQRQKLTPSQQKEEGKNRGLVSDRDVKKEETGDWNRVKAKLKKSQGQTRPALDYNPQTRMQESELSDKMFGKGKGPQTIADKLDEMGEKADMAGTKYSDGGEVDLTEVWDTETETMNLKSGLGLDKGIYTSGDYKGADIFDEAGYSGRARKVGIEGVEFDANNPNTFKWQYEKIGNDGISWEDSGYDVDEGAFTLQEQHQEAPVTEEEVEDSKDSTTEKDEKTKTKREVGFSGGAKDGEKEEGSETKTRRKSRGGLGNFSALNVKAKKGAYISKYFNGGNPQDDGPSFAEAFNEALKSGEKQFMWRGKTYKTDLKEPGSAKQAERIGWSDEKIQNWIDMLEKRKSDKKAQGGVKK